MKLEHKLGRFRLEITSLEEFATFISIIRSEELDADKIAALTARLNKSTQPLADAIQANTLPKP